MTRPRATASSFRSCSRAASARLIGTAVETTIRTFTKWERAGIVETTPDGFALHDAARLEDVTIG
ncbi:MAG: helix-turn-helix domain-containing protein [Polyangiaceae bacterium]